MRSQFVWLACLCLCILGLLGACGGPQDGSRTEEMALATPTRATSGAPTDAVASSQPAAPTPPGMGCEDPANADHSLPHGTLEMRGLTLYWSPEDTPQGAPGIDYQYDEIPYLYIYEVGPGARGAVIEGANLHFARPSYCWEIRRWQERYTYEMESGHTYTFYLGELCADKADKRECPRVTNEVAITLP